ncbi:MAG: tripartite tricarboxylate transporter substrate binding protein [Burkholderiales bacterium]|nr:tripartite tricarboxylate transporter substrate binding protein [Burkholderiales bacterium]
MNKLTAVLLAFWGLACVLPSYAQSVAYPVKPVRLLVGQAPGGATDVIARLVNPKLAESMGQSVIVENRTGAAGSIAAALVAKSAPDGYNLLVVSSSYAINPSLYTDIPFDPLKDLAPISLIAEAPFLLVVHPSTPVRSVKELIALAKSKPGLLNYASGGNGSSGHLAGELFTYLANVNMVHIPYKGAGPALVDVIAGQVHLTFGSVLSSLGHVKSGRLRALGVTGSARSSGAPELPTIAEAGLAGYQTTTWYGLLAPANTPADIVSRLSDEMKKAVNATDVRTRILTDGAEPRGSTPREFQSHLQSEMKRASTIIKRAGIKP